MIKTNKNMNAYYELLGKAIPTAELGEDMLTFGTKTSRIRLSKEGTITETEYTLAAPNFESEEVACWLRNILWAHVVYEKTIWMDEETYESTKTSTSCILKSDRSVDDEMEFLKSLKSIDYDNGYGTQYLFGTIVFKDGSWMDRGEYDGSEWWNKHTTPTEPDWLKCE